MPMSNLHQCRRTVRQPYLPAALTDDARRAPDPGDVRHQHDQHDDADIAVDPGRQTIDGAGGLRRVQDAETEHGGVAEPEGQASDKADLRHLDGVEPVSRIDAVAHGATGEYGRADIVADRVAGEAGECGNAIGNFVSADRAQCEPVVECQREIAAGNKQRGAGNLVRARGLQRGEDLIDVDIAQHVE